jgi:DNA-binding transcriptional ArsR family regulator
MGTQKEFEQLVSDVRGHALTLNLLGSFLRDAHGGDIRKRDLVKLEVADAEEQSGHAFHVMDTYVKSFKEEGEKGKRALAILRLLGLFDRPATADCLNALWSGEEIGGLTGPLIGISEAQRNITLKRLEDARLVTVNRESGSKQLVSLDAHPLLREYFATRVRDGLPRAWRAAHRRTYEHLRDTTDEGDEPTLEDLQPLYQAVAHGCQAGLHQEANDEVYWRRIERNYKEAYASHELGAFASNLGALACFFDEPWSTPSTNLKERSQVEVLGNAAFYLRALGRLAESLEPIREGATRMAKLQEWEQAAIAASNLSELELTLGDVSEAAGEAEQSVTYADRSGDAFQKMGVRTTRADALHQAGRQAEAEERFREAEQIQAARQPDYPLLYSVQGFRYCDLLLAGPDRAAWRRMQGSGVRGQESEWINACSTVTERAVRTLDWSVNIFNFGPLSIALNRLTLGRAELYAAILSGSKVETPESEIENAVSGLRRAGTTHHLPRGLLTRAWLRFLSGSTTGPESAQEDLDEAWEISERGPMRLFMADIYLYRARLFHKVEPYPWNKFDDGREGRGPKDDLDAAEKLINDCGYHRRDQELADAKLAILGKT